MAVKVSVGVTSLAGRVNDGPTPVGVEWTPTHQDGACQLLEPSVPFCDPPCGGAALCVHEGVCQAYPRAHSVGTVHVTGIRTHAGANAFDVDPVGNQYQYSDAPFPGFEDGDPLRVGTGGGDYDPFTVPGTGITPLDVPATEFTLRAGQPLSVDWAPPPVPGTSTIHVKLDISHHGGSRGAIECDAPDTGHLEVGAGLVRDLLDLGVAGFPTIGIARKTVGSVDIAVGRVDLIVTSDVERPIVVPGVVSCTDDSSCPAGAVCLPDLTCSADGEPVDAAGAPGDAAAPAAAPHPPAEGSQPSRS